MRSGAIGVAALGLLSIAALWPASGSACECVQRSLETVCRDSNFAFAGVVESATEDHGTWLVRVRVVRVIAGPVPGVVELTMGRSRSDVEGELVWTSCSSTRHFEAGAWVRLFLDDATDRSIGLCSFAYEVPDETEARADPCTVERITRQQREHDELERRAREPPARGGCASCAVGAGSRRSSSTSAVAALFVTWVWRRRRGSRARRSEGLAKPRSTEHPVRDPVGVVRVLAPAR